MNDETITVMVLAATLGTFAFLAVQLKVRRARRHHSFGDMCRPSSKVQTPPGDNE